MKRIASEVQRELRRFSPPGGMPAILEAWAELVGETIARNAWPARIGRDGTLHVAASSSTWAFELSQLAPAILERLCARLGDAAPTTLRFAPGHVPDLSSPVSSDASESASNVPRPGPAELALAAELAAEIGDDELREAVAKAAALSLARAASSRAF